MTAENGKDDLTKSARGGILYLWGYSLTIR